MIRAMLFDSGSGQAHLGDQKLLTEWSHTAGSWIWVDLDADESLHKHSALCRQFKLNSLAIDDTMRKNHPPKLEVFDSHFFLLLRGLTAQTQDLNFETIQMGFFVGDNFLLTRQNGKSVTSDTIWQSMKQQEIDLARGPSHLLYRLIRATTDCYNKIIEGLDPRLEQMEDEMFSNPRDSLLETLISDSRNIKRLRRVFSYHKELLHKLAREDFPFINSRERHEFTDAYEHTERLASLSTLYKELTEDLMSGYISVTTHRLNKIMQLLTIVTVIIMPLTLVAGIYGMNFEYMPELGYPAAYFVVLGVMLLISLGLLVMFRKLRWL